MKHSIIKDFKGWTSLTEAAVPPGPAGAAAAAATAMAPPPAPPKTLSAPGVPEGDATPMMAEITKTPLAAISSADGSLTKNDIVAVQKILIAHGSLAAKQASGKDAFDGLVGPATTTALGYFRQANGIFDEQTKVDKQKGVTIGAKTLAKINEFIKNPSSMAPAAPATPAAPAQTGLAGAAGAVASAMPAKPAEPAEPAKPVEAAVGAKQVVDAISAKFQDAAFWKPFKGRGGIFGNDDEKNASAAFGAWYDQTIQPMIDKMAADDKNKATFGNLKAALISGIERKLNKVPVAYTAPDGTAATVTINADF
jgi:hypothetical protein